MLLLGLLPGLALVAPCGPQKIDPEGYAAIDGDVWADILALERRTEAAKRGRTAQTEDYVATTSYRCLNTAEGIAG